MAKFGFQIDKPWVICLGVMFWPAEWGKLTQEHNDGGGFVLYSKQQMYPEQAWNGRYLKKFKKPEHLLCELLKWDRWRRRDYLLEDFHYRFPDDPITESGVIVPNRLKTVYKQLEAEFHNWAAES